MPIKNKLLKNPLIAKVAAKLADNQLQQAKFLVGTYANTRKMPSNVAAFGNRFMTKKEFVRHTPNIRNAIMTGNVDADTLNMAHAMDNVLAKGSKGLKQAFKNRQRAGKAAAAGSKAIVAPIHNVVNAHGKGIVFRRIGGRIVPVRKK